MKKAIFILMLIAATVAVKQSNAQARPVVVRSPMIRPSVAVKSFGIINHHVGLPTFTRLVPQKGMVMSTTITPTISTNSDGSTTVNTTITYPDGSTSSSSITYNPDGTVRSSTPTTITPPPPPPTTTNPDGTTTTTITQAINKNSSDEQLPPPQTIRIDDTHSLQIIFVWSGAGGS